MAIPAELRRQVTERAGGRCEYCGLAQEGQEATFHVDHVVPVSDHGTTELDNLALACVSCSLRKGARRSSPDPHTGRDVRLFNPRTDRWADHFAWLGVKLIGKTDVGRATASALHLNRDLILAIREEETVAGRFPPPW